MTSSQWLEQMSRVVQYDMPNSTQKKSRAFLALCKKDASFLQEAMALYPTTNDFYNATYSDLDRLINRYYRNRLKSKKEKQNLKIKGKI